MCIRTFGGQRLIVQPKKAQLFACVPEQRANQVTAGNDCSFPFECVEGLECLNETCHQPCDNDTTCAAGHYCATDYPAGAVCLPEADRLAVGEPCDFGSQCVAGAICYDGGEGGLCRLLCPSDSAIAACPAAVGRSEAE